MNPAMANNIIKSVREKAGNVWLEYLSHRRKRSINKHIDPAACGHLEPAVKVGCEWYGTSYGGFFIIPGLLNESSVIIHLGPEGIFPLIWPASEDMDQKSMLLTQPRSQ